MGRDHSRICVSNATPTDQGLPKVDPTPRSGVDRAQCRSASTAPRLPTACDKLWKNDLAHDMKSARPHRPKVKAGVRFGEMVPRGGIEPPTLRFSEAFLDREINGLDAAILQNCPCISR